MKVSSLLAIKNEALGIDFISSINVLGEWTVPKLKKSIMSSLFIESSWYLKSLIAFKEDEKI